MNSQSRIQYKCSNHGHPKRPWQASQSRPFTGESELTKLAVCGDAFAGKGQHFSMIDTSRGVPPTIQPKLNIGPSKDKFEDEADRVADQTINRLNMPSADAQKLQMPVIQRISSAASEQELPMEFASHVRPALGGGNSLPQDVRHQMESAIGGDFTNVRIHTDAQANYFNEAISSQAFTAGQDIFFSRGEFDPNNDGSRRLLAHELTHVIQQRGTGKGDDFPIIQKCGNKRKRQTNLLPSRQSKRQLVGRTPTYFEEPKYTKVDRYSGSSGMKVTLGPKAADSSNYGSGPKKDHCRAVNDLNGNQYDGKSWIKGHLLNDNLGGPGEYQNLTPLTDAANMDHSNSVERKIKNFIVACGQQDTRNRSDQFWYGMDYKVTPIGQKWPGVGNPGEKVFSQLECEFAAKKVDKTTQSITDFDGTEPQDIRDAARQLPTSPHYINCVQ